MMENPFYITGIIPEPYFCDREKETTWMVRTLENRAHILLTSPRRMGKTQLIRHVFEQPSIKDNCYTFYTDIYPTMLNYLGYDKPYMAFGCDLLSTPADQTWAVNYLDGIYQYAKNGYVLQFDGEKSIGFYKLTDYLMAHNLVEQRSEQQLQMEQEVKAIIQQYMMRMLENRLVPEGKEADK